MLETDLEGLDECFSAEEDRQAWLAVGGGDGHERALHPVEAGEAERLDWLLDAGGDERPQPRQVPLDWPPRGVPLLRSGFGPWSGTGKDPSRTQVLRVTASQPDDA